MITVYKTTNLIDGKVYVGQRTSKRMAGYYGSGKLVKQALAKYSKENFIVEEIDYAYSSCEADQKETLWIQECDCLAPKGYNICPHGGTTRGAHFSEEICRKFSAVSSFRRLKGIPKPEEQRQKMRLASKGKPKSEEHCQNMRKPKSEEHNRKNSESHKGQIPWNKGLKTGPTNYSEEGCLRKSAVQKEMGGVST
jgi:group I intron endonuclease